jgi:hypothetical protein
MRKTMIVDSRDRDVGVHPSSSAFVAHLPEPLNNVSSVVLVNAELPLTYYMFSKERENTEVNVIMDGQTFTATIPDGNYTPGSMATALEAAMNASTGRVFIVTYATVTSKYTISCAEPFTLDTTPRTAQRAQATTDWGLGYYLGFQKQVFPSGMSLTSSFVASLTPENYLLIHIDGMNDVGQTGTARMAFAKVPLDRDSYQYHYYDKTLTFVDVRPSRTKVTSLKVEIRFHDGTLVDLNGGEWSMSLEFICTIAKTL